MRTMKTEMYFNGKRYEFDRTVPISRADFAKKVGAPMYEVHDRGTTLDLTHNFASAKEECDARRSRAGQSEVLYPRQNIIVLKIQGGLKWRVH